MPGHQPETPDCTPVWPKTVPTHKLMELIKAWEKSIASHKHHALTQAHRELLELITYNDSIENSEPVQNAHITEFTVLPDGASLNEPSVQYYAITVRHYRDGQYSVFNRNRRWNGKHWSPILDRFYPEETYHFPQAQALKIAHSLINGITCHGLTYKQYRKGVNR